METSKKGHLHNCSDECKAIFEDHYSYTPPTFSLDKKSGFNLGDFEVEYIDFPDDAKEAFQFAVDIWDALIDSPVPIKINATYRSLNSGVLGSASPTNYEINFSNKADPDVYYPIPIAEKIYGGELNNGGADISCRFNSDVNWYFDFNNPTLIPSGEFDFVSVVLHEIGHGLGFVSAGTSYNDDNQQGGVNYIGTDTDIFSFLLEDGSGENLYQDFDNLSTSLGDALTGNNLYLNSPYFSRAIGILLPRIYAPQNWNGGSSISHLDEVFYESSSDKLMTPNISQMEVIHDPGLAANILFDLGWKTSFIIHDGNDNSEDFNTDIIVDVEIETDKEIDSSSIEIVYSTDGFRNRIDTQRFVKNIAADNWLANLPAVSDSTYIEYYISLKEKDGSMITKPRRPLIQPYKLIIDEDIKGPDINHLPISKYFIGDNRPIIEAVVNDDIMGVDSVIMEFKINDGAVIEQKLISENQSSFMAKLDFDSSLVQKNDIISYRIVAVDLSNAKNVTRFPTVDFFEINVEEESLATRYYENDFDENNFDFTGDFKVNTPDGFINGCLNSEHPYENAGSGNQLEFTANLRVPIIIAGPSPLMTFDEIVLVEPGQDGVPFGDQDFWDYVIVEGSKDNGTSWQPFVDGYDARAKDEWLNTYNSGLSGQVSSANGTPELYNRRFFNLISSSSNDFMIGDTLLIRFRLFSDPFAVGWGWAIDNIVIQADQQTTSTHTLDPFSDYFSLYPNPANNLVSISNENLLDLKSYIISDLQGRKVIQQSLNTKSEKYTIDISGLDHGIYFISLHSQSETYTAKFLKAN